MSHLSNKGTPCIETMDLAGRATDNDVENKDGLEGTSTAVRACIVCACFPPRPSCNWISMDNWLTESTFWLNRFLSWSLASLAL